MQVYPHRQRPFTLERSEKHLVVYDDVGRACFTFHTGDETAIKDAFKRMARALGVTGCRMPAHLPPSGNTE